MQYYTVGSALTSPHASIRWGNSLPATPRQSFSSGNFGRCRNVGPDQHLWSCSPRLKELIMSVQLLVIYPPPKDPAAFDRAYRDEHLPYAGPRLIGATGVTTKRVLGAPSGDPIAYAISVVEFPSAEAAKACAQSIGGQEALQHAAAISTGGPPSFLLIGDAA
jgi:uncharacterized protein (TIGR02118 family)